VIHKVLPLVVHISRDVPSEESEGERVTMDFVRRWGRKHTTAPPAVLPSGEVMEEGMQRLFRLVTDGLERATHAFVTDDRSLAQTLVASDPAIDSLQLDLEGLAVGALVARSELSDEQMRLLVSVLRIVPELERSADLVEHIALRTGVMLIGSLAGDARTLFAEMGATAVAMWRTAGAAWSERDTTVARRLRDDDDLLDDLHVRVTQLLASVPLAPSVAIELGLVARFFERLGDHAVNITRRIEFLSPRPFAQPA
jgi:phosphate transport system protein